MAGSSTRNRSGDVHAVSMSFRCIVKGSVACRVVERRVERGPRLAGGGRAGWSSSPAPGSAPTAASPDFRGPAGRVDQGPGRREGGPHLALPRRPGGPGAGLAAPRRRRRARGLEPNAGHRALVDLERSGRLHTLITQNVDGLHQAAGSDPAARGGGARHDPRGRCASTAAIGRRCRSRSTGCAAGEADPPCRRCGGILKSATISFGQNLVPEDLERADAAARACDLLLAVGTTLAVYPDRRRRPARGRPRGAAW